MWNYLDEEEIEKWETEENKRWKIRDQPSVRLVLREINGYFLKDKVIDGVPLKKGDPLSTFAHLQDDGTTACGAWIYTGVFTKATKEHPHGQNHAANRKGDDWVALGWGFAWPANRRLLYNRASADPKGNPWPKEARLAREYGRRSLPVLDAQKAAAVGAAGANPLLGAAGVLAAGAGEKRGYVYWDAGQKKWVGFDVPDFVPTKPPDAKAKPGAAGLDAHDGASPFIMKADGKGWLFVPNGLVDGPMPTHYEPYESPVANALYKQQSNPVALVWKIDGNPYATPGSKEFPHVLSTYRLTEHHLSGVMSRWLPWLVELQPELFCEISPEHAEEIGVGNTDWVVISTPRASIRAKALVTRRIRPYKLKEKTVHHVGLPWHWGYKGLTTGDVVNNLSALVGDPNVTIHEAKVFVCQVAKARR